MTGWSCPPSPPSDPTGWPNFPPAQFPSHADLHYSSPNVQAWAVGNTLQLKVVHQVKAFFRAQRDDDDMEDSESEDEDEDDEGAFNGDYSGFFLKLFQENEELRGFYEKNHENGEFACLVCGGVGFIRRFKDCVALVQHTVSISKTKKMKAHRAFGQVVCKVLGWDINKLPSSLNENKNAILTKLKKEKLGDETETGEKESASAQHLSDNGALAVAEVTGDGNRGIPAKLEENAADIEQGSIERPVDCVEAGPDNGRKYVGKDVDVSSVNKNSAAETLGKEATGNEMLPTTDVSNPAQESRKEDGSGKKEDGQ